MLFSSQAFINLKRKRKKKKDTEADLGIRTKTEKKIKGTADLDMRTNEAHMLFVKRRGRITDRRTELAGRRTEPSELRAAAWLRTESNHGSNSAMKCV